MSHFLTVDLFGSVADVKGVLAELVRLPQSSSDQRMNRSDSVATDNLKFQWRVEHPDQLPGSDFSATQTTWKFVSQSAAIDMEQAVRQYFLNLHGANEPDLTPWMTYLFEDELPQGDQ